jgi:hypothetical protein
MAEKFEIQCPCCQATIVIEAATGNILWHKEKQSKVTGSSIEAMLSEMEAKKSEAARRLEREMESQKDRSQLLDKKFKEALERAAGSKDE